jgi:hypothetical protein
VWALEAMIVKLIYNIYPFSLNPDPDYRGATPERANAYGFAKSIRNFLDGRNEGTPSIPFD